MVYVIAFRHALCLTYSGIKTEPIKLRISLLQIGGAAQRRNGTLTSSLARPLTVTILRARSPKTNGKERGLGTKESGKIHNTKGP